MVLLELKRRYLRENLDNLDETIGHLSIITLYNFFVNSNNYVRVSYTGILPDLFREEQGVVVQGKLIKIDKIKADQVFAKHDENYMPTSIKKQLEKNEYWNKSYQ